MLLQNIGFLLCPQNMGYKQWLQQWAFHNTRKFKFTMKRLRSRWPCLLGKDLGLLAMSSLVRSSSYLSQILSIHIYMTEPFSVCMHDLVGLETLGDWV